MEELDILQSATNKSEIERTFEYTIGLEIPKEPLVEFLATYGKEFRAAPKPKGVHYRKRQCCFVNVSELVSVGKHREKNWIYCEGLASRNDIWFHHAWAADRDGNAIDPTWRMTAEKRSGVKYFGVPFERYFAFVNTDNSNVLKSILVDGVEPQFARLSS